MKKLWKLIPVLAIGLIAALGAAGCAETGHETAERAATAKPVAAAVRTAVVYAADDGTCEHDYEAAQTFAATCTEQGYTVYTCANCGPVHIRGTSRISVRRAAMSIRTRSWTKRGMTIRRK